MATKQEEAIALIQKAVGDKIDVTTIKDGDTVIKVITVVSHKQTKTVPEKGKWARVAEEMARENLLGGGRGDRLRDSIREFREGFAFRDVFSENQAK